MVFSRRWQASEWDPNSMGNWTVTLFPNGTVAMKTLAGINNFILACTVKLEVRSIDRLENVHTAFEHGRHNQREKVYYSSVARWSIWNFWRFGVKISVETKKNREIRIFISVFCCRYIFKGSESEWSDRKEDRKWKGEERGKTGQCQFIRLFIRLKSCILTICILYWTVQK